MPNPGKRPRLAVIVANSIHGDSRVQKTALAAAHAGWEVLLVGRALGDHVERSWFGPVKVVRVPVAKTFLLAERIRRDAEWLERGGDEETAAAEQRAERRHEAEVGQRTNGAGRIVRGIRRRIDQRRHGQLATQPYEREDPVGDWRRDTPQLLDLDHAFGPVIERFNPDVIHCNDITMLPTAAWSAASMRAAGKKVAWLYDAHEYVAGVDWPTPRMSRGFIDVETDLIHSADAVVTVSPEIADLIAREQKLAETPLVVRNTPVRASVGTGGVSVRAAAGLSEETPLLVYSGYLHHERGIGTAIEALEHLPEHHLVIVSGSENAELKKSLQAAEDLEVDERVHVVPYVPQHLVADYLSTADAGIICSKRTINYELSLPTKLAEYLHAGLPVVVSDVKTLSKFVQETGVGEVFASGDSKSFVEAVRRLDASRDEHTAKISDSILDDLSWEAQMRGLLDLYRQLAGRGPSAPDAEQSWLVTETPRGRSTVHWRPLSTTPVRLGLGPTNSAGQLAEFARAITTAMPEVSAEVFEYSGPKSFGYAADIKVKRRRMRRLDVQLEQTRRVLRSYSHLIVDSFRPVTGGLNGPSIADDLPALIQRNVKVALVSHGSDVRDPAAHLARVPHSLYRDAPPEVVTALEASSAKNRRIAAEAGLPVFATTPDLLADLPNARWAPLAISPDLWASDRPVLEARRPKVLHAPSRRWTKGTDLVLPLLEGLAERGVIELQMVEGLRWRQMRQLVQECDIVVDQFSIGSYGTFACEAMAAGRPVVAWLSDDAVEVIGETPPIVNSLPHELGTALEELLDDRDRGRQLARDGVAYVHKFHDGRRTAEAFSEFLKQR